MSITYSIHCSKCDEQSPVKTEHDLPPEWMKIDMRVSFPHVKGSSYYGVHPHFHVALCSQCVRDLGMADLKGIPPTEMPTFLDHLRDFIADEVQDYMENNHG